MGEQQIEIFTGQHSPFSMSYSQKFWATVLFGSGAHRCFDNVEQWMWYNKAVLFGDANSMLLIGGCMRVSNCRMLGQQIRGVDVAVWNAQRVRVVKEGTLQKFLQDRGLGNKLLDTRDRTLAYAAAKDKFWGTGLKKDDPGAMDPAQWKGRNELGRVLMEVRDELRQHRQQEREAMERRIGEYKVATEESRSYSYCEWDREEYKTTEHKRNGGVTTRWNRAKADKRDDLNLGDLYFTWNAFGQRTMVRLCELVVERGKIKKARGICVMRWGYLDAEEPELRGQNVRVDVAELAVCRFVSRGDRAPDDRDYVLYRLQKDMVRFEDMPKDMFLAYAETCAQTGSSGVHAHSFTERDVFW
jgi:ribA/ribD-fused uncharacterized protein